jgi:sugar phosphate isomerase/epimerase
MAVQLALTPDRRWEFATADLLTAARKAGFTSVGIGSERADHAVAQAYTDSGLACHEVLALVVCDDESATLAEAEQLAQIAVTLGAPWVLTVFTTPLSTASAALIRRCANLFDVAGVAMAVEFSPLGPVPTLRDGLAALRAAERGGRAGLIIDSWHFCFGESSWEELAAVPLDDIAYLQFTDARVPESDRLIRETLHFRTPPGEGALELHRFAGTFLDRGFDGMVSVEVLNAGMREQPVNTVVEKLYDASAPYWLG